MRIVCMRNSIFWKMEKLTVVVLAVLAGTSGFLIKVPTSSIAQLDPVIVPSGWIHIQKLVNSLFENVCEASTDPAICRLSEEFSSSISASDFMDPDILTKFQALKTGKGFLPKGQIFSEYNKAHTDELKIIFEVMRNAMNFDTFYKIAAWARQNLNCGLYVNLIYLALENRRDTEKLTLPPPYELLPNYFIRKDIIIQGSSLLAGETFTPSEGVRDEGNAYTLDANYTANFYDNDDESKLAYFREDIGLNSFYFLSMLKNAPWLNENVDINSRYGENMYHMMKQLVARYNLERNSNGMPELDNLSWNSLSDAPYDPMLVYSNGNEFIHRTSSVQLPENEDKALLQTIENNIGTVVSHMRENGYNKTQVLNHLMEIVLTGERSYDTLARQLLGKAFSNNGQPTVFEHYMTSLRDPMIWRLYKKITELIDNSLKVLLPYERSELFFPGVQVMSIDVKKMMTNFDYFEFDITDALKIGNGDMTFQVKIGQPRLSHKPFSLKINISSLVTQKGLVKIYLGPKIMPGEFIKNKNRFYLLDAFDLNLKRGSNIITRSSNDMNTFAPDFMSLNTIRKKVEDAQFGLDSLPLNTVDLQIGFPERLIIPRGTPEGLPLQLFVFVAPYMKTTIGSTYSSSNMEFNTAVLSPLYPLDLTMDNNILLGLPNALVKDLVVTHKGVSKVNNYGAAGSTKSWYSNQSNGNGPIDYSSNRGQYGNDQSFGGLDIDYFEGLQNDDSAGQSKGSYDYSTRSKQTYDYKSKRPQYKKPDYLSKRVDYKTLHDNKMTEKSEDIKFENVTPSDMLLNKNQDTNLQEPKPINKNYIDINQNIDLDDRMLSDDSSIQVKSNVLKSSESDLLQKKDKFNYKDMRPQIIKPDYKKIYKAFRKTTENPQKISMENEMNKKSKQIDGKSENEMSNVEDVQVLKFYQGNVKKELDKKLNDKLNDDVVVDDVNNVDIYKILQDMNEYSSGNSIINTHNILPKNKMMEKSEEINIEDDLTNNILANKVKEAKLLELKPLNQKNVVIVSDINTMQNDDSLVNVKKVSKSSGLDPLDKKDTLYSKNKIGKQDDKKINKIAQITTQNPLNIGIENETMKKSNQVVSNTNNEMSNVGKMQVFKVYKNVKKVESNEIGNNKLIDDVIVEDVGNVDIYKVLQDMNENSSDNSISNKYKKVIINDVNNPESSEYFGVLKDDENETFLKVIPVTQSPEANIKSNSIYKYIMRVVHNSSNINDVNSEKNIII